jgi:hypothetical protein
MYKERFISPQLICLHNLIARATLMALFPQKEKKKKRKKKKASERHELLQNIVHVLVFGEIRNSRKDLASVSSISIREI